MDAAEASWIAQQQSKLNSYLERYKPMAQFVGALEKAPLGWYSHRIWTEVDETGVRFLVPGFIEGKGEFDVVRYVFNSIPTASLDSRTMLYLRAFLRCEECERHFEVDEHWNPADCGLCRGNSESINFQFPKLPRVGQAFDFSEADLQLNEYSKLLTCSKCGNFLSRDTRFCPECGSQLIQTEPRRVDAGFREFLAFAQALSAESSKPFLSSKQSDELERKLHESGNVLPELALDEQGELLSVCLKNFGILVVITRHLELLPDVLRYALLSKVINTYGACGMPVSVKTETEHLLELHPTSFWTDPLIEDAIYDFREEILQNPLIGIEPIQDLFFKCGDLGMISAMLENPICPKILLQAIIDRQHLIFEKYETVDLEDLVEVASEILTSRQAEN